MNEKIKSYVWVEAGDAKDSEISAYVQDLKKKGIDGFMCYSGHDREEFLRLGKIIKEVGSELEFHVWLPTLMQRTNPELKPEWYVINSLGESAFDKPMYVPRYQFVCPNREGVINFLLELYGWVSDIEEVDGVHLDYIRFPDVILPRGLWKKYNLFMDKEYPQFDYCYCDKCVADFQKMTGIQIKNSVDPSQIEKWKTFRYDLITNLVNRISQLVHSKNKKITAAVYPGPTIAREIVRQEWKRWNVDALYPMNYNDFYLEDVKWVGEMCNNAVKAVNNIPIYSGLFICPNPENKDNEPDPENQGLLPKELEMAIQESMENGAAGICLYTSDRMTEAHWKVFRDAIRKDYTKK